MKIVIPVASLEVGGTRYLYQLANQLVVQGHRVEFVMPEGAPLFWPVQAKVTRVPSLSPTSIPAGDFILPNWWATVRPAYESHRGRIVRLSLGYEPMWVSQSESAKQTYLIDAPLITISEWHRQLALTNAGRDSVVIHGGVDHTIFHPHPKSSQVTGRKSIFYIHRAKSHGYYWKGTDDFWQACTRLRAKLPDFDINVVTPENQPFNAPVPCNFWQAGSDHVLAKLYAEADLFVSTSYFESFSLPPLEAMACGTAVVTTDSGGNRDYTQAGVNCLVVPPSDIGALAGAMEHLLRNDTERARMALAGYNNSQTWTWQQTGRKMQDFLLSLH